MSGDDAVNERQELANLFLRDARANDVADYWMRSLHQHAQTVGHRENAVRWAIRWLTGCPNCNNGLTVEELKAHIDHQIISILKTSYEYPTLDVPSRIEDYPDPVRRIESAVAK